MACFNQPFLLTETEDKDSASHRGLSPPKRALRIGPFLLYTNITPTQFQLASGVRVDITPAQFLSARGGKFKVFIILDMRE